MIPNVLSIAGSDPSGGAGIQADLKAISSMGGYGMAALTALTAQNTQGVSGVHLVPAEFLEAQVAAVFEDIDVHAVKIGMIATADLAQATGRALQDAGCPIVLDPVMVAKGGASLLAPEAVAALRSDLLPKAHLLTPNLPEGAALVGGEVPQTRARMEDLARALSSLGPRAVLLKGGHLEGADSPDLLVDGERLTWFEGPRVQTANTHGTGCTLSSALATGLAHGGDLDQVVREAKDYVSGAIGGADRLRVGQGHGPTDHFWRHRKPIGQTSREV